MKRTTIRGFRLIKTWDGSKPRDGWIYEITELDGTQHFSREFRYKWLARLFCRLEIVARYDV